MLLNEIINEVGMTKRAVKYYEEKGLLSVDKDSNGYHLEVGSNLYHICEFAERMEQNGNTVIPLRSSLPEQCYVFVQTENCVGIVKKGESGFYRTDIQGGKPSETNALVNEMNKKLGLSKGQAEAMKAGSMFGWDTPAADPKSYDKNGIPVRPKQKDYER